MPHSLNRPYDFQTLLNDLHELNSYPFIEIVEIARSVEGRPIWEVSLGNGPRKVHMNGSFHANEWITSAAVMAFIKEYAKAIACNRLIGGVSAQQLFAANSLSIVPMVNPDGVELVINGPAKNRRNELLELNEGSEDFSQWKANIRGVDLNNQYPANWEIEKQRKEPKSPAPRDYPGDQPLSEPEAIAMAQLQEQKRFDRLLAFHTQGAEFYWGYEGQEPEEASRLAEAFERASGYQSVRYIDSHAGYKDWYINEFKGAGFTVELGIGCNPLPLSQFHEVCLAANKICIEALKE
ncbi:g-D-glutamyl-meso-diaminopimelate peptidase [Bacillus ectoiniformans]|uniref:M14 family metallopeptidase n=1 Tax=Bacillus ectoiniformans TaxID=1494429 RepID=UPI00195EFAED|nr:M14 family metallocarboxypeptidase [Bacillus ectoiniformans]MBM7650052.1 g-D-glutamyl-meso-diaminopimelate peptidase [Bacillus ectoiniformans]